ncbi:MAG: GtrA family protein [Bacilli bacterium]|nr:GtrA family protein [Bacilli bacterium]
MENEKKQLTKEEKRREIFRAVKYTLFAASAGIIEFGSFTLLTLIPEFNPELNHSIYWIPALISLVLSVIWNFTFNRRYTFQSANNIPVAMLKVLAYYVVFAPLSIWLAQIYLIDTLEWNEFLVKAVVMLVNFITEFLYQRFFVFRDSLDTRVKKTKLKNKEE